MRRLRLVFVTLVVLFLTGCVKQTPSPVITLPPSSTNSTLTISTQISTISPPETSVEKNWWQDAVFYEIYVRSFYDSDGDGIGDFNGLSQKLDYLNDGNPETTNDLGVTALWLMPIMPSPSVHGYDVTDYYAVNLQYGTMDEFKELLSQVHQRGMRLILDLPQNHTSSEHTWFVASQDPASPFRDWYIWEDADPGFLGPWNKVVWHPLNDDYFYGYFWEGMPDLNYTNPDVTAEMRAITRFWLKDIGVDGFRLDAIGILIEEGQVVTDTPSNHQWLKEYHEYTKELNPEAFTVGEVWSPNETVVTYLTDQEVDLAFNFDLATAIIQGINEQNPNIITGQVDKARDLFPGGLYGVFATNHDMDRIMTQLGNDPQKAKAAASIYLTLPGVPFIFYGEEIGMGGVPKADHIRYPMQWSGESNAGFTTGTPWLTPLASYPIYNGDSEIDDPDSLLAHYKKLIALRNEYAVIRKGRVSVNTVSHPQLYSTLSELEGSAILTVVNLSGEEISNFSISLIASGLPAGEYLLMGLMGESMDSRLTINSAGGFEDLQPEVTVPAYGTLIYLLTPQ
jgi:alpha-amylase